MVDTFSKGKRSEIMAAVHGRGLGKLGAGPSTNFSRIHEWDGADSSIRGLFVDGLRRNRRINENQQFLTIGLGAGWGNWGVQSQGEAVHEFFTNSRMGWRRFEYSWFIRGWFETKPQNQ